MVLRRSETAGARTFTPARNLIVGALSGIILLGATGCVSGTSVQLSDDQLIGTWSHQATNGESDDVVFRDDHTVSFDLFPVSVGADGIVSEHDVTGKWAVLKARPGGAAVTIAVSGSQQGAELVQTGTFNDITLTLYIGDPDSDNRIDYKKAR